MCFGVINIRKSLNKLNGIMAFTLNTTTIAERLGYHKSRISQLVANGTLDGCFEGDGRRRRFDLELVTKRLNGEIHPGQAMGNGSEQAARRRDLLDGVPIAPEVEAKSDGSLPRDDQDRYRLAKLAISEEDLKKRRRENALADGTAVYRREVERNVGKMIGAEVVAFENTLRGMARMIADQFDLDFKSVNSVCKQIARDYRIERSKKLGAIAASTTHQEGEPTEA